MIRFFATDLQDPVTKQYLNTCPKNATSTSTTAAESLLDTINIYFQKLNMRKIKDTRFQCLYVDEAESSSHKENFSMFVTHLSPVELKLKTTFFGIVNLNGKTADGCSQPILSCQKHKPITVRCAYLYSMKISENLYVFSYLGFLIFSGGIDKQHRAVTS